MLREVLARAGTELPGCRGAALVCLDGVVMEQWTAAGGRDAFSMEPAAAEVTSLMRAARSALRTTQGGPHTELALRTSGWAGVVRTVGESYFLIVLTAPDALMGVARFVAERAAPLLEKELG